MGSHPRPRSAVCTRAPSTATDAYLSSSRWPCRRL
jgi:hypothetical protein